MNNNRFSIRTARVSAFRAPKKMVREIHRVTGLDDDACTIIAEGFAVACSSRHEGLVGRVIAARRLPTLTAILPAVLDNIDAATGGGERKGLSGVHWNHQWHLVRESFSVAFSVLRHFSDRWKIGSPPDEESIRLLSLTLQHAYRNEGMSSSQAIEEFFPDGILDNLMHPVTLTVNETWNIGIMSDVTDLKHLKTEFAARRYISILSNGCTFSDAAPSSSGWVQEYSDTLHDESIPDEWLMSG